MSSYSSHSSCSFGNDNSDDVFFDISDYLAFNDEAQEEPPALVPAHELHRPVVAGDDAGAEAGGGGIRLLTGNDQAYAPELSFSVPLVSSLACRGRASGERNTATSIGQRVAFRTKTQLETLDDGYKWKKYGKKKVKNSPNPRKSWDRQIVVLCRFLHLGKAKIKPST